MMKVDEAIATLMALYRDYLTNYEGSETYDAAISKAIIALDYYREFDEE